MMFVLKSKLTSALFRISVLQAQLDEANSVANNHYKALEQEIKERAVYKGLAARRGVSREYWQQRAEQAEAKLAELHKPKQDAGARAFDNIVRYAAKTRLDADFSALELRVLAHYGLTAAYGGTLEGARKAVYEGHAAEGGLQKHSIGEEYPFVVYGQEFRGRTLWCILDTRTGNRLNDKYYGAEAASSRALGLKKYNLGIGPRGTTFQRSK